MSNRKKLLRVEQSEAYTKQHVFGYLNVLGLGKWQALSREDARAVDDRSPVLCKHHNMRLTSEQSNSLRYLSHPRPAHFWYLQENLCFLCGQPAENLTVCETWHTAAHRQCLTAQIVNVGRLGDILPLMHLKTFLPCVDVPERKTFNVLAAPQGLLPDKITLFWYRRRFRQEIAEHVQMKIKEAMDSRIALEVQKKQAAEDKSTAKKKLREDTMTCLQNYQWFQFKSYTAFITSLPKLQKKQFLEFRSADLAADYADTFMCYKDFIREELWEKAFSDSPPAAEEWATLPSTVSCRDIETTRGIINTATNHGEVVVGCVITVAKFRARLMEIFPQKDSYLVYDLTRQFVRGDDHFTAAVELSKKIKDAHKMPFSKLIEQANTPPPVQKSICRL
jgi:hypothetical protein